MEADKRFVKFILTKDKKIFFAKKRGIDHEYIAKQHKIPREDIKGGGVADLLEHRIYGTSYTYGPYDPEILKELLPDWQIDPPYKITL